MFKKKTKGLNNLEYKLQVLFDVLEIREHHTFKTEKETFCLYVSEKYISFEIENNKNFVKQCYIIHTKRIVRLSQIPKYKTLIYIIDTLQKRIENV